MSRRYPARPIVGVGVIVWADDRVLLIRRGQPPRQGQWSLPGGAQQLGETVAETARREVREEAGIEIELGPLVAIIDLIERDEAGAVRYHYTLLDYGAEATTTDLVQGDDATDAGWFDPAEIGALGLWSETVRVIGLAGRLRACP